MKTATATTVAVLFAMAACTGDETQETAMAGMSAEEHAHMQGGMAGATDSTGATIRQTITLTPAQEQTLGVMFGTVQRATLRRSIRTVGRIAVAEPRVVDVAPKIDGFIEELFVDATGQTVQRGEALFTLYSPALVAAQEELLTARRMADRIDSTAAEAWHNAQTLLHAARRRLEYWDITAEQVQHLEQVGQVSKELTLVAPASGIVLEKDVVEGQRIMSGDRLYRIADLTEVWVEGDVFEQDLQLIRLGSQAHIEVSAYPGHHVMGRVSFVYPTMDEPSRTNRVRVSVRNDDLRLKPGMFATVFFDVTVGENVLAVPLEAVVVTGERNVVFVRHEDGSLMPHDVVLGLRAGESVQVLSGVREGQTIVTSANFLVDAESRLGSAGGAMAGMDHGAEAPASAPDSTSSGHEGHNHD